MTFFVDFPSTSQDSTNVILLKSLFNTAIEIMNLAFLMGGFEQGSFFNIGRRKRSLFNHTSHNQYPKLLPNQLDMMVEVCYQILKQ